ncbi:MAG: hypothetical protein ACLFUB_08635 [Cyclobacteriaceae bacterium]
MKHFFLLPAFLIFLAACQEPATDKNSASATEESLSPEEAQEDSLFKEMMSIHDEVMPKMDNIMRLKRSLRQKIDSLQQTQTQTNIPTDSLQQLVQDLEEADDAMMNWMRSNDFEFEGMSHEEIMEELRTERENIIVVREKMLNSIEQAQQALEQIR